MPFERRFTKLGDYSQTIQSSSNDQHPLLRAKHFLSSARGLLFVSPIGMAFQDMLVKNIGVDAERLTFLYAYTYKSPYNKKNHNCRILVPRAEGRVPIVETIQPWWLETRIGIIDLPIRRPWKVTFWPTAKSLGPVFTARR